MYNELGIVVALAEVLLPFMVLALDAALLNIDRQLYDAARNLGAGAVRIFFEITLPLSMPGVISGSVLVFTLAISAYVTPALIGGPRVPVMSTTIYQQGIALLNWPFGAAIAFVLLVTLIVLLAVVFRACIAFREGGVMLIVVNMLILLYLLAPVIVVIATAFTTTAYPVFPPQGFTLKWF